MRQNMSSWIFTRKNLSSLASIGTITAAAVLLCFTAISAGARTQFGFIDAVNSLLGTDRSDRGFGSAVTPLLADSTILAWDTNGLAGNEVTFVSTTTDLNLNSSSLSRGSGLNAASLANAFSSSSFTASATLPTAITNNDFLQFTVAPISGQQVSLSALNANFRRSSTGPNEFQWQYSLDGFSTAGVNIGSAISYTGTDANGLAQPSIDLSGITALQNVANPSVITIRLYGYGASSSAGTFAIGLLSGNDLAIIGSTASAAIPVQTLLDEDFADNDAGWTLGPEWEIGPATVSAGHAVGNPDPGTDTTPTADNGVAGIVIGGNSTTSIHDFRYLTSPPMNAAFGGSPVTLRFNRWLNSDYANFMINNVQVWDGLQWVDLWVSGGPPRVTDSEWVPQEFDLTAYQNNGLRVRFGKKIETGGAFVVSSWNLDDIVIEAESVTPPALQPEIAVDESVEGSLSSGSSTVFFESEPVGTPATPATFTVRNEGQADLTIDSITIDGTNSSDFALDLNGLDSVLTPGETTTFTVTFTPGAVGLREAVLHVESNDQNEDPFNVNLQGFGEQPPPPSPTPLPTPEGFVLFNEDFSDNEAGWTLGPEWQIGPAMVSTGQGSGNPDPGVDNTPTTDNGVAGIVIGGNSTTVVHDFHYLTSPPINTFVSGPVTLWFNRWLNSDYSPFMINTVEVWNGTEWVEIWATAGAPAVTDSEWTPQSFDISAYKNAELRVRFGKRVGSSGAFTVSSWNLDDVFIFTDAEPLPPPTLNIDDVSLAEGNSGPTEFKFTVTLSSPAPTGGVTFDIATADGTAQDGNPVGEDNDYIAQTLSGQVIDSGSSGPYEFIVTVNGDTTFEPDENFFVNITNIVGAAAGDTQGEGTIENDDVLLIPPAVTSITRNDPSPTNANAVTFTVNFSESVTGGAPSNFALTTTGPVNGQITGVTGTGSSRTVTVSSVTGTGFLRLDMSNSAGVTDVDGAEVANVPYTSGQTYSIDNAPPETFIILGPPTPTSFTTANFQFFGTDLITGVEGFECSLDGSAFSPCTSTQSYFGLADGQHTFRVRAIDEVGNVDPTPAERTWTVDTMGPTTSITSGPPDPTTDTSATFEFTADDAGGSGVARLVCRLDNGPPVTCSSPRSYTNLGLGDHFFEVYAIDAVGNPGLADTYSWKIVAPPAPNIVINEVDVDQTGTDTMEFVELYDGGAGNTPLDGLVVVFFNGGNDLSYASFDLDGQTTNADGYFTLGSASVPGVDMVIATALQNGADAIALYEGDAADFPNNSPVSTIDLRDALVYDTGQADDAGLLVLLNPGQPQINENAESSSATASMQRCPNGAGGERNTSTYKLHLPTPAGVNVCPVPPPAAEGIIINEVDVDQEGTDTLEFIELYDGGVGNTALDGLVVVLFNGGNDQSYAAFDLDGQVTNSEGYFTLGSAGVPGVDMVLSVGLQNGQDAIALYEANAANFPNNTAVTTVNLRDALVYDTGQADDAGLLILLNPGQPQINENEEGSATTVSMQRCPNGAGGARNTSTYALRSPTPGGVNTCPIPPPPAPNIIINEVDVDQVGNDTLEFVELYDGGVGNTPLDGLVLVFYDGNGDVSYAAVDLDGAVTDAAGYYTVGDAGVTGVDRVTNFALMNGADAVALYAASAFHFPNGTSVTTANLRDALVYDTGQADDAGLLVLLNAGQPQINENGEGNSTVVSMQRCLNGTGGERNTYSYRLLAPTPDGQNICPIAISGNVIQLDPPFAPVNLAGVEINLSGDAGQTAQTDSNGDYAFDGLLPGGVYTVTPTMAGKTFDPISRTYTGLTTNITNANFTAYNAEGEGANPRNLRVENGYTVPGQTVSVPLVLTATGNEARVKFRLTYDTSLLSSPNVACGAASGAGCTITDNGSSAGTLDVTVDPVAVTYNAGQREVAVVTFNTTQTNQSQTPLNFTAAQGLTLDASNNPLLTSYTNGYVVFEQGMECDLAGRFTGDGLFQSDDGDVMRHLIAGAMVNRAYNEFQRADCAPFATKGDGVLDATDFQQSALTIAVLEPQQTAGGPFGPLPAPPPFAGAESETQREMRVVSTTAGAGDKVTVDIELHAQGDETAASFTLAFDPMKLRNAQIENAPAGTRLTANTEQAAEGRVMVLVDGSGLSAQGIRRMVSITFDVAPSAPTGETLLYFTSDPTGSAVSDKTARPLPTRFTSGTVTINGPNSQGVNVSGRVFTPEGAGLRNAQVVITDETGTTRTVFTSSLGYYTFEAIAPNKSYRIAVVSKRYRFAPRNIEPSASLTEVDFTAKE